jgi:hypothetical protein
MLLAVVVASVALGLMGCSGGSLPAGVPITVTGFVETLANPAVPVSGAVVTIQGHSGTTGADGSFTILQVPAVAGNVVPVTVNFAGATPAGLQVNESPLTVTFTQNEITAATANIGTIDATPAGTPHNQTLLGNVTGFVKNLAASAPVVGAVVTIEGKSATTAGDGSFTIINVLGPQTGVAVTVDLSSATPANQALASAVTADPPASGTFNMGTIFTVTNPPGGPGGL